MGFWTNLFLSGMSERRERRRHHISRSPIGFLPEGRNVIVCGGSGNPGSLAEEIKENAVLDGVLDAAEKGTPTLCLFSDKKLICQLLQERGPNSRVVVFGEDLSYMPFDRNITFHQANELFSSVLDIYGGQAEAVRGILSMLLSILSINLGSAYFTWDNLRYLVSHLFRTDAEQKGIVSFTGEEAFLDWVEQETGCPVDYSDQNVLTLGWANALSGFRDFWLAFDGQVGRSARNGAPGRSLYSCLLDGQTCAFHVPELHGELLLESLLQELAIFRTTAYEDHLLIDCGVKLESASRNRLFDRGSSLLVGDTFLSLGIADCAIPTPSFVCLGVSNQDAKQIFEQMAYSGVWRSSSLTIGRHTSGLTFSDSIREPITPNELSYANIPDGSAYLITPDGCRRVSSLLT